MKIYPFLANINCGVSVRLDSGFERGTKYYLQSNDGKFKTEIDRGLLPQDTLDNGEYIMVSLVIAKNFVQEKD
ncbi:MAG: hypothetical protein KGL39_59410 [Patescibacteria group bacterium]|nr:hypothetical protein [Patescibacteria group bacterium]